MLNEICTIVAVAVSVSFVSTKCCIYIAITTYLLLTALGMSPVYCVGYVQEVDGANQYHSWVRVGSYDIEQSTLNLCHYDAVNYNEPDATFNTTSSFIDRVDMWSPIKSLLWPKGLYRINDTYSIAQCVQEKNIMNNNHNIINDGRTSGTDVSNRGDYGTMTVKGADGEEISFRIYGR